MKQLDIARMNYRMVNQSIESTAAIELTNALGQRYIGVGSSGKRIVIGGVPGNALGAYLNGSTIEVLGNAQDATGDTMNDGTIIIGGSCGDATGYAMRGGRILVRDRVGYRAGIHMKAYKEKVPVLVVGGEAGCFLGEYQAGGIIIVLGLQSGGAVPVDAFCATGMHGGSIYLRCDKMPTGLPDQVTARQANDEDIGVIRPHIALFCASFGLDAQEVLAHRFYRLTPDTKNPYKQLYTIN